MICTPVRRKCVASSYRVKCKRMIHSEPPLFQHVDSPPVPIFAPCLPAFLPSRHTATVQDRLQASSKKRGTKAAPGFVPDGAPVAGVGEEGEEPKASEEEGVPSPPNSLLPPTRDGGSGDDDGERPAGDMATTRPRLCLWQRRGGGNGEWTAGGSVGPLARRREVTFRGGDDHNDGKLSTTPPEGAAAAAAAATLATAAIALERENAGGGGGVGGGARIGGGQGLGNVLRPDFLQLSYAMKKSPVRGGGSGSQRGQVRKKH